MCTIYTVYIYTDYTHTTLKWPKNVALATSWSNITFFCFCLFVCLFIYKKHTLFYCSELNCDCVFVDCCICYWLLTGRMIKYANYWIIKHLMDREMNPSETCIQCTVSADVTLSLMFYRSVIKAHFLLHYKCDYEICLLDNTATALLHYSMHSP